MFHKKISNVLFVSVMVLVLVGVAQATPIVGTFDSRTVGSTIVANVPWAEGASITSFWEDPPLNGGFTALMANNTKDSETLYLTA